MRSRSALCALPAAVALGCAIQVYRRSSGISATKLLAHGYSGSNVLPSHTTSRFEPSSQSLITIYLIGSQPRDFHSDAQVKSLLLYGVPAVYSFDAPHI